jgi:cytochrome c-type biogenesis protein CcmE
MDPSRKRKIRLIVALGAAVLLAGALMYTSFTADTPARTPSQLISAGNGSSAKLTGKVVDGSVRHQGDALVFAVRDRDGTRSVPVRYKGVVPDPFRDGREVIVSGKLQSGTFVGERDSLITKCPSKFQNADSAPSAGKRS